MNIRKEGIFIALILLLLGGPLAYFGGKRTWFQWQLDRELDLARQEGIVVDAEKLWPGAPVPADQNARALVVGAMRSLHSVRPAPPPKEEALNYFGFRIGDFLTYVQQDPATAKLHLRTIEPELQLMEAASLKPFLNFERRLDDPNERSFEIQEVLYFVRAFSVRAWLAYSRGDLTAGRKDLATAARLCRLTRQEPSMTAAAQADEAERYTLYAVVHVLSKTGFEPRPLALIKRTLADFGPLNDYRHNLRGEFLRDRADLRRMLLPDGPQRHGISSRPGPPTGRNFEARIKAETEILQGYRKLFRTLALPHKSETEAALAVSGIAVQIERSKMRYYATFGHPDDRLPDYAHGVLNAYVRAPLRAKAQRRVMLAFAQCMEIRQKTGAFPSRLPITGENALDPFRQKPLRYRRTSNGFLVYSVGNDDRDNGGHISRNAMPSRDIVAAFP